MNIFIFFMLFLLGIAAATAEPLPENFVYLKDIDPTIIQEMRYAGSHNFMGRPAKGYEAATCILTKPAALALHKIQNKLRPQHYSLKVYDCYRPQMAVDDFERWSKDPLEDNMRTEFYPRVAKHLLFQQGYIADHSGHTRGSTIDLTLVDTRHLAQASYHTHDPLTACFAPPGQRFWDNSIDMGTGFDCLDVTAHGDSLLVSRGAYQHRQYLKSLMKHAGFEPYALEWWHFTLKNEPYLHHYFNFLVK